MHEVSLECNAFFVYIIDCYIRILQYKQDLIYFFLTHIQDYLASIFQYQPVSIVANCSAAVQDDNIWSYQ
jgi:hypothetical protein